MLNLYGASYFINESDGPENNIILVNIKYFLYSYSELIWSSKQLVYLAF